MIKLDVGTLLDDHTGIQGRYSGQIFFYREAREMEGLNRSEWVGLWDFRLIGRSMAQAESESLRVFFKGDSQSFCLSGIDSSYFQFGTGSSYARRVSN